MRHIFALSSMKTMKSAKKCLIRVPPPLRSPGSLAKTGLTSLSGATVQRRHSETIMMLQEVLAMRLGIVEMRVHGVEEGRVLRVAVMLVFPQGLFRESFLLVLLQ